MVGIAFGIRFWIDVKTFGLFLVRGFVLRFGEILECCGIGFERGGFVCVMGSKMVRAIRKTDCFTRKLE